MLGLTEPPTVVKVEGREDRVLLHVSAPVDPLLAMGARGTPRTHIGLVSMSRHDGSWLVVSEAWTSDHGVPAWEGLIAPGVFPEEMVGSPVEWPTNDLRTVIAAESAFQSANGGWYGPLECLREPASCVKGYPKGGPAFVDGDMLATAGGFARRFDPGSPAPPDAVGPGKASARSIESFAYWIIPEDPGARARCGDNTGVVCEMPDASAPPTKGTCPQGCTPIG